MCVALSANFLHTSWGTSNVGVFLWSLWSASSVTALFGPVEKVEGNFLETLN